jgi:hypothetical protein
MWSVATVGLLCAASAHAQQPNLEEMMKWGSAKTIRYHVVGEFKDSVRIGARGGSGYFGVADAADRVEVDFDWSLSEGKLIGKPVIKNFPASLSNLRNAEPKCAAPTLHGTWDYDLKSVEDYLSGTVLFNTETRVPAIDVPQFCTGSPQSHKERVEQEPKEFGVPSPVILAMRAPGVSDDGKTIVAKVDGWSYTLTPSVVD